ncbi:unnamed protein product [Darwinula stevensoni]|uniref:SSD domain-containing protein n=1 Tax=Darwinula stevensoni TaxID=69355 RepID=A0A7R8X990_9CRUS|nr:unnamed protein product [Darwinula stevensoni]CAG0884248.1 unnamed protein product [Darwinula stevensoni]
MEDSIILCFPFDQKVPVLRSFCFYTTVGIFFVYVMTLIFMVPIMSLDERRRDSGREGCLCIRLPADYKKNRCSQKLLLDVFFHRFFGPLLVNPLRTEKFTYYRGNADYFREKEALEELFNRLSALPGIKNRTTEFWFHSFLEYLKDEGVQLDQSNICMRNCSSYSMMSKADFKSENSDKTTVE